MLSIDDRARRHLFSAARTPPEPFRIRCSEPHFSDIRDGRKTVEGRKSKSPWSALVAGDRVQFVNGDGTETFEATVTAIRKYPNLRDFLSGETLMRVLPRAATLQGAEQVYLTAPVSWTPEEILANGILALEIRVEYG